MNGGAVASIYDGEGSVRQLTNTAGTVTDSYEYDAFGNKVTVGGSTPNEFLYRGEQYDSDLDFYYLRARYYNPSSGRFTGVDPLTDKGEKRYEYANAAPVNGADPTGTEDLAEYRPLIPTPLGVPFHFPTWCNYVGPGLKGYFPSCAPPPPPPPQHGCFAQLKYRSVSIGNATHAFWWIQDTYGQRFVIEGGPSDGDIPPWGYVTDWVTLGNVSIRYPADNATLAGTWFDSGLSTSVCGQVTALKDSAEEWPKPNDISYYPWGPNSNSFARYVGEQGLFNPSDPPGSVGWSTTLPTPHGPK